MIGGAAQDWPMKCLGPIGCKKREERGFVEFFTTYYIYKEDEIIYCILITGFHSKCFSAGSGATR